jgi:hypothetical protein
MFGWLICFSFIDEKQFLFNQSPRVTLVDQCASVACLARVTIFEDFDVPDIGVWVIGVSFKSDTGIRQLRNGMTASKLAKAHPCAILMASAIRSLQM